MPSRAVPRFAGPEGNPGLPAATGALILANLLTFAALLLAGAGLWHTPNGVQLAWGANFGPATQDGQWWRLGSALFLHFGVLHLATNLWALWDGGRLLERMIGPGRLLAIYFAAGLGGNLASLALQGGGAVSGGASGAVFGLYGALVTHAWQERRHLDPGEFRWLFWGAAGFTAAALAFGFLVPGIDNAAHAGGLATGLLAGLGLRPGRSRALAGLAWLLAVATLIALVPPPRYRWSEEQQAREEIRRFLREDADISARWQAILEQAQRGGQSFDDLAGAIDRNVTGRYEASFEALSSVHLADSAPSATTLETLRRYAEQRREASRALTEGLRHRDPQQVRGALEQAARAGRTPAASVGQ
jgi:rhomboid protease GluP